MSFWLLFAIIIVIGVALIVYLFMSALDDDEDLL